jgi:PleD family two-component response regulator
LADSEGRSTVGEIVRATVSVGLTPLTEGLPIDEAFRLADAALYRAKHNGRNQLSIAA